MTNKEKKCHIVFQHPTDPDLKKALKEAGYENGLVGEVVEDKLAIDCNSKDKFYALHDLFKAEPKFETLAEMMEIYLKEGHWPEERVDHAAIAILTKEIVNLKDEINRVRVAIPPPDYGAIRS